MDLKKTALYSIHEKLGAKMVEFAGYKMPIQYKGIREEHRKVRETVGVFDVSHMGEFEVSGKNAFETVQKITINDVANLEVGQAQYTAMCYENGGIVDDLLVYKMENKYLLVVNAANRAKDLEWVIKNKEEGSLITDTSDSITQLAIQGKMAEATLQKLTKIDLSTIKYYHFIDSDLAGVPMLISRSGYTGEPGFEIYFENKYAIQVWKDIFTAGAEFDIEPIGLAARDSLRLEKKMYLYGNDIDHTTNPIEAGLGWITKLDKGYFIGSHAIRKVKENGAVRKLIAFKFNSPGFPRKGYKIFKSGNHIGEVTSGTVSPILEIGIGLGYVVSEYAKIATEIEVEVRNKMISAEIIKPPFV